MQQSGQLIADRYRLDSKLGEGGMGVTWLATDQRGGREVVVKFLRMSEVDDWKTVELFEREIHVLQSLNHPRVPRMLQGSGDIEGEWFLVQERAPGRSAQVFIDDREILDEAILRGVADQVLEILVYLQERQPPIIHRDVKPDNLIIDDDGNVQLVDFGAASLSATDRKLGGSTVVGTFGYMAPEQFRGVASANTDLYGLGMSLVVLATGKTPEQLENVALKTQFRDQSTLSPAFEAWLDKMIEPAMEQRFSDARSALRALRSLDEPGAWTTPNALAAFDPSALQSMRSFTVEKSPDEMLITYKPKAMMAGVIIMMLIVSIFMLFSVILLLTEALMGLFMMLFCSLFVAIGLNQIRSRERLFLTADGQWTWEKRNLLGTKVHSGHASKISQLAATETGMKVNNRKLYQLSMSTYGADHDLFKGLQVGEATGAAHELSLALGLESAGPSDGVSTHIARAFDEALNKAAAKGGLMGGLAQMARGSQSIQRAIRESQAAQRAKLYTRPDAQRPGTYSRSGNDDDNRRTSNRGEEVAAYEYEEEDVTGR